MSLYQVCYFFISRISMWNSLFILFIFYFFATFILDSWGTCASLLPKYTYCMMLRLGYEWSHHPSSEHSIQQSLFQLLSHSSPPALVILRVYCCRVFAMWLFHWDLNSLVKFSIFSSIFHLSLCFLQCISYNNLMS